MKLGKMIFVLDSHTAGEPTRVVIGGIPYIPGKNMVEKKEYLANNLDFIRTSLMQEPRGHMDMFGAIITPSTSDKADFGVVFMDCSGYVDMCGHGSIGVAAVAVETGIVKPVEPITTVTLDTPAGVVTTYVNLIKGDVKSVTIRNVPSFLYKAAVVDIPKIGEIPLDIAFGGVFYAIVNAKDIGAKVEIKNSLKLRKIGTTIRKAVDNQVKIEHPEKPHINKIFGVRIYDVSIKYESHLKNVVIFGEGQLDRSPCGTGTCAHMATLYSKGQLKLNEESVHESIIGTTFKGKLIAPAKVGEYKAVIPEISGNAYITGMCSFILHPNDPLKHGFLLR